jgi:hypothetical protein
LGLSQTEADILAYDNHDKKKEILRGFYSDMRGKYRDYLDKSFFVTELAKLDPLFTTEKELNKDKNIILYHGMATSIYAADYIGTRLQLMDKPNNQDFLSLRQGLEQHVAEQNTQTIENERNIRKNFLEKSGYNQKPDEQTIEALACESDALDPRDNDTPKNNYRVSCSPSLTGSTDYGRSSLESALFAAVCNSGPRVKFDTHNVPQEMMQRYRARLDSATQALSDQCPDSGILLQMALSQKLADKSVYASLPYGFKHNIYTKQTPSQKLEKPSQLFAEVHNNPFNVHVKHTDDNCSGVDPLQLRLIVDKSLLLNPNNPEVREGFKVKAYAMNQEALDTFHREVDGIVSEIGADMQTKNKQ